MSPWPWLVGTCVIYEDRCYNLDRNISKYSIFIFGEFENNKVYFRSKSAASSQDIAKSHQSYNFSLI